MLSISNNFITNKRKGFTFAEIIVSLAVIISFAYGTVVVAKNYFDAGRYNTAKTDVAAISMAVSQYKFEIGNYPASLNDLLVKVEQYGPWLSADIKDPWGNDYRYSYDNNTGTYAVWSCGSDGKDSSGSKPTEFKEDDIGIIGH